MDYIKEAFQKVKMDMDILKQELDLLKENLAQINEKISNIEEIKIKEEPPKIPTYNQFNSAHPTHNPTHFYSFKPLKPINPVFSTGNEGVPTDKQTDKQTNRQVQNTPSLEENSIDNAVEILNSLDSIKKEIRLKFKRLTEQEIIVFSTLYQLSEENGYSDYKGISKRLNLSESSIRDYIGRLIKKGIPVEKNKLNNKNIQLSISENLKKIASLSTILHLRDL